MALRSFFNKTGKGLIATVAVLIIAGFSSAGHAQSWKGKLQDFANRIFESSPADVRQAKAGKTLDDCAAELTRSGGGWCELAGAAIADVFPKNLDRSIRMGSGPSSVIRAPTGAAFDSKNLKLYFYGGGATDYGGNEVYEFDLRSATWRRLNDPSPLTRPAGKGRCRVPENSPPAAQTIDGFIFSKRTGTILMLPTRYACYRGRLPIGGDFWEFNPSDTENRNGLSPLAWRKRQLNRVLLARYGGGNFWTAETPDGRILAGNKGRYFSIDPQSGETRMIASIRGYGSGSAIYDPRRKLVWLNHSAGLATFASATALHKLGKSGAGVTGGSGMALMPDGRLLFWDGGRMVHTYDPDSRNWTLFDWSGKGGPNYASAQVYSKWVHLPGYNLYVGYVNDRRGVWVYRHPDNATGVSVLNRSIQPLINKAAPGSVLVVPPGIYRAGAKITKPLTLRLKGVRILGATGRKSVILVRKTQGKVIIEDFRTIDRIRCGNCAGIKAEGQNFDVTIRRAHIANSEMGIITDNRGGRLLIEDSVIEDIGVPKRGALSHLVYVGRIDSVTLRRSLLRRSRQLGHLLKSRARVTTIERTALLGLDTRNSREIDLPCGGTLNLDRVVIHKGPNADNMDSIAVGMEPQNCKGRLYPGTRLTMTRSWLFQGRPDWVFALWRAGANAKPGPISNDAMQVKNRQDFAAWLSKGALPPLGQDFNSIPVRRLYYVSDFRYP
jgi:hypothetical protein